MSNNYNKYDTSYKSEYINFSHNQDLDNALYLHPGLFPNPKSYSNDLIENISNKLSTEILGGFNKKLEMKYQCLKNILSNIILSIFTKKPLAYTRSKNSYTFPYEIYETKHFSYTNVLRIIDNLQEFNYIEGKKGFIYCNNGEGRLSRIWSTKKMIELLQVEFFQYYDERMNDFKCNKKDLMQINNSIYIKKESLFLYLEQTVLLYITIKESSSRKKRRRKYIPNPTQQVSNYTKEILDYNEFMKSYEVMISTISDNISITDSRYSKIVYNIINNNNNDHNNNYYIYDKYKDIIEQLCYNNEKLDINICNNNIYNEEYNLSVPAAYLSNNIFSLSITSTKSLSPLVYNSLTTSCHRVFNDWDLTKGGRFYGPSYQHVSKKSRANILIAGLPTVEIDYSTYHLGMLYNMENLSIPDSAYELYGDNPLLKEAVKYMFNIFLNSRNRIGTLSVFEKKLEELDPKSEKQQIWIDVKNEMKEKGITPRNMLQRIEASHKPISKYFNSGVWGELQFKDSGIANEILKRMIGQNIPCLVIHDSFIVPEKNADILESVMREEYRNRFNFDCKLKRL